MSSAWSAFVAVVVLLGANAAPTTAQDLRLLELDDLFALESLYSAAVSPDGEWVAAVVIRPAAPGEVYGRTFYEQDVTRADVWLISRRTGERRNLTQGARDASGHWCATWSPDGRRIAMLSTKPEGGEPRGGDNVRLHVWDRERDRLTRLTSRGMMAQTLGGSALYRVDLRNWEDGTGDTARCGGRENAPFLWLDDTTLLAVTLPHGRVSGLLDASSRALAHAGETLEKLRHGTETTMTAVESGEARHEPMRGSLKRIDVAGRAEEIATVPAYELEGVLQVSLAPNRRSAAVLATIGVIPPADTRRYASPFASWGMEKRLGFVELAPGSPVRWLPAMPEEGRYVLDLLPWSDDGRAVAIRARATATTPAQALYAVSARDLAVRRFSPEGMSVAVTTSDADVAANFTVMWTPEGRLLARARREADLTPVDRHGAAQARTRPPARVDWWLFAEDGAPENLTAGMPGVPSRLRLSGAGQYVGIVDGELWVVDARRRQARRLAADSLPAGAEAIWPRAQRGSIAELLVAGRQSGGARPLVRVTLRGERATATPLPSPAPGAEFIAYEPGTPLVLWSERARDGTRLWATDGTTGRSDELLKLNEHLADVAPSARMLIEYRGNDGDELEGAVILPPDYRPGRRYPVVVWVYAGAMIRDTTDRSLGVHQPGMYNLHLYAARGYVVLMPSMPLRLRDADKDDFIDLPKGALPAIDRLIELGIADPDRLAVMGQSYGGFSTYALVTYTNRFKAAIAMAGLTDLVSLFGQFDATARSYEGIEHHKSVNWALLESGQAGMGVPPMDDLWRYLRNSPLYYVDRVRTPLLLIHGEQDVRGPMTQAEEFFYALYRQGRRARLLRYWGDDHGLRLSPANVRSVVEEIFAWLEAHMPEPSATAAGEAAAVDRIEPR